MSGSKRAWPPWLALSVSAVVLIGAPWTFKLASAPKLGEPCGGGFDCRALDGRCVASDHGRYCTVTCEHDSDCPSSGHCGIPPHDRWQVWFSASELSERYCVPGPRPEQPPKAAGGMPGSGEAGAQFRPPEQRGGLGGDKLHAR